MQPTILPLTEHEIQACFFQEVSLKYRNDPTFRPALFYAVLNGAWIGGSNQRSKQALIAKYKEEGWKSGIADFHYDQPRGSFSKLVIEFKRTSKRNSKKLGILTGGLEPEQIEYLQSIAPYAFVSVCYTSEEAVEVFNRYMSFGFSMLPGASVKEKLSPLSVAEILGVNKE